MIQTIQTSYTGVLRKENYNHRSLQSRQRHRPQYGDLTLKCLSKSHNSVKTVTETSTDASQSVSLFDTFQCNVEGEWRGSMCSFDSSGDKISLPHLYIPEAYKEWGMELFDWQTHCTMEVKDNVLRQNTKTLYTGTGCECDTIASEESTLRKIQADLICPNGSYCVHFEEDDQIQMEACFAKEVHGSRHRIVLHFKQSKDDDFFHLDKINLFIERYLGPLGSDVDITDYSTRVRDVSLMEKTSLTDKDLSQYKLTYLDNNLVYDHEKVIPLNDGVFVFIRIRDRMGEVCVGHNSDAFARSFGSIAL